MTATKEQERKALEQIKKIVEGLGEDSYVAAAFEGCFEMAESNIKADFGCSWKQTAEKAFEDENHYKNLAAAVSADNDELREQLDEMSKRILEWEDLDMIRSIVCDCERENSNKVLECEKEILEFCENPKSDKFQKAVRNRKCYRKAVEQVKELEGRLITINEAYRES